MNKKLFKLGALTLGLFAVLVLGNNVTKAASGDVSLTINAGETKCYYLTSLNLGAQNVALDTAYTFSGDFTGGNWMCTDYIGLTGGWTMTVQMSGDLTNGLGNSISKTGVSIQHPAATVSGASVCTGGSEALNTRRSIGNVYSLIERAADVNDSVCSVTIPNVSLQVAVPANQAPGTYVGTFVVTVPNNM